MGADGTTKVLVLRRDDRCVVCGVELNAGTRAQWDRGARVVTCLTCVQRVEVDAPTASAPLSGSESPTPADGEAGASARREYERRRDRREQEVRSRHPRLGGLILALSDESWTTTAWKTGSTGEQKLGASLDELRSEGVVVLHDRRIPGGRANIDHLVVAASGIHVIDAKRWSGRVEISPTGSLLRPGPLRLRVGRRDGTSAIEGMARQVAAVERALASLPWIADQPDIVRPRLCFVDADWGWLAKPETVGGVRVSGPRSLKREIVAAGNLTPDQVRNAATLLRDGLPPA